MSSIISVPQNLAETVQQLEAWRRAAGKAKAEAYQAIGYAAEHVSHAYDYASDAGASGDVATTASALPFRNALMSAAGHLGDIEALLKQAQAEVKKAVQAMDEADARRSAARRKLTL